MVKAHPQILGSARCRSRSILAAVQRYSGEQGDRRHDHGRHRQRARLAVAGPPALRFELARERPWSGSGVLRCRAEQLVHVRHPGAPSAARRACRAWVARDRTVDARMPRMLAAWSEGYSSRSTSMRAARCRGVSARSSWRTSARISASLNSSRCSAPGMVSGPPQPHDGGASGTRSTRLGTGSRWDHRSCGSDPSVPRASGTRPASVPRRPAGSRSRSRATCRDARAPPRRIRRSWPTFQLAPDGSSRPRPQLAQNMDARATRSAEDELSRRDVQPLRSMFHSGLAALAHVNAGMPLEGSGIGRQTSMSIVHPSSALSVSVEADRIFR